MCNMKYALHLCLCYVSFCLESANLNSHAAVDQTKSHSEGEKGTEGQGESN